MSAPITIRAATSDEVPLLRQLILELAAFEHLSHEVIATEAGLREHLFGDTPCAHVLLAEVAAEVAGFALFFHSYSTFLGKPGVYLEDLYVREAWRGQGVGTALLAAVRQWALAHDCGRLEWSVLNWNRRAIQFYEKMGARPMAEWTVYRLTGTALSDS